MALVPIEGQVNTEMLHLSCIRRLIPVTVILEVDDHFAGVGAGKEPDKGLARLLNALIYSFFRGDLATGYPTFHILAELRR